MRTPYNLYILVMQIFTLLYIHGAQGSELIDSLRCVNNFKSNWKCHWREKEKVQDILPMDLYYRSNENSPRHRCNPAKNGDLEDGNVHKSCSFDYIFTSVGTTSFTFLPQQEVHAEACVIPASKVRMPPPKDLKVQISNNGKVNLTWKMSKSTHPSASTLYQVTYYRKDWETWEDSVSLNVLGRREVTFSSHSFIPGSTYLFRVRSVAQEDPTYRSLWSKELSWTIPADHGAIIQNLNCEYDGSVEMRCSWEMKRELLGSVSFHLYYMESSTECVNMSSIITESPNRMKVCHGEKNEIIDNMPYVHYTCSLQVASSKSNSWFRIHVRMKEEEKSLMGRENIQIKPPTDLRVKDKSKNGYTLEWSPPEVEFNTIQLKYQLCYWKKGEPECPAHSFVNVSGNPPEHYFPVSKLEGTTNYTAKVRAKADEKFLYSGPWSEWSQSRSWETSNGLTDIICISVVIISVATSLFAFFAFKYSKRFKQRLDDSLPNPRKSKLLGGHSLGSWKQSLYPFIQQDFYEEEEKPTICIQISPVAPLPTYESAEDLVTEKDPNAGVSLMEPNSLPLPEKENIIPEKKKCESLGNGEKSEFTRGLTLAPMKGLSNNGPYFMFTGAQSMSNLMSNEAKHPGYFSLPNCKAEIFSLPKEMTQPCQPQSPANQMGYVVGMEKSLPVQPIQNEDKKCAPDNKYFAIPASSDFQISPEGPLMIINPDGSGPLLLKQVGDYCFFPGLNGSQENLERKITPNSKQNQQNAPEDPHLPAVQAFKVMQRGYLALPPT